MKRYEYVMHGTSNAESASGISESGLEAIEGRATVTPSLLYAFRYAYDKTKGGAAQKNAGAKTSEPGKLFVFRLPKNLRTDYEEAGRTFHVDEPNKNVRGISKFPGGRAKLALYKESEIKNEVVPASHAEKAITLFKNFLTKIVPTKKINIDATAIALEITPTDELKEVLWRLEEAIRNLEPINVVGVAQELLETIPHEPESTATTRMLLAELVETTIEAETTKLVRSLSLGLYKLKGYRLENETPRRTADYGLEEPEVEKKIIDLAQRTSAPDFQFGSPRLTRYLKINLKKLHQELEEISSYDHHHTPRHS